MRSISLFSRAAYIGALVLALVALGLCLGCNEAADTKQAGTAVDEHAGHNHAPGEGHGEDSLADDSMDEHAGHDHAPGEGHEEDSHAGETADEHAGHDHAEGEEHGDESMDEHGHQDGEADDHADHSEDDGHDHSAHEESGAIELSAAQIQELGISSAPAGPGGLGRILELTGEVSLNEDEVAHVSPRVGGTITQVKAKLGDHVEAGAVLVVLDSIELAEAKAEYLASLSRIKLAQTTSEREQLLLAKGISSEQDYLAAQQALEEEQIVLASIGHKLRALGLSENQVDSLPANPNAVLTSYEVIAPVSGEITAKHAAPGEVVGPEHELFTISDLSSVWVRLAVHQQDFQDVREGIEVEIDPGHGATPVRGIVDYIEPLIGESTRTAIARVTLSRSQDVLRPGLFVTGHIEVNGIHADIVLPRTAVVDLDSDKLVFIRDGLRFTPQLVTTGRETSSSVEILSGLEPGIEVAVTGSFQLKAELLKGTFDPHAGHAH